MSLSGFVGAYMTEEAERVRKLNTLEKSMLTELKNSVVGKAGRFTSLWAAMIDGFSPAFAAVMCLTPFFISSYDLIQFDLAIQLSIAIALSVMFLLGVILGKISSRNMLIHGAKMLVVGLVITLVFIALKMGQ